MLMRHSPGHRHAVPHHHCLGPGREQRGAQAADGSADSVGLSGFLATREPQLPVQFGRGGLGWDVPPC